ncbi:MAG: hypothetical protein H6718_25695 [Polyangiaceae bacterium]|nr:hypothetical protein [Myxococcales bacterium]MCB9588831.1 hypothetical protein [Polyangiaceae bacterium]MCB9605390.1 hypothetical protein [Polyangiaceae bacterium]
MNAELDFQIPGRLWEDVREVRSRIATTASGLPRDVAAATVMCASELVENALKYGTGVPGQLEIAVHLHVTEEQVTVEVTNGVAAMDRLNDLTNRITQIQAATDRQALYLARLQELLDDPTTSGKLGLYRIGYEGQFDLSCKFADNIVSVRATRGLQ